MASFSSGVMISKSEADRRKGDEMRMRKQGIDPSKGEDLAWGGAVVSRRQHRQTRVEKENEKEREEAEALPMDAGQIVAKRPENRLKWLQRALMLASKGRGRVQIGAVYDIVTQSRFVAGVSKGVGSQMRVILMANLHLFSTKQQRALQSETSRFSSFVGAAGTGKSSSSGDEARGSPTAATRAEGTGPGRRGRGPSSARGSRSRSRRRSRSGGEAAGAVARARRQSGPGSRSRSRSRKASVADEGRASAGQPSLAAAGAAGDAPATPAAPAVKIKMQKWQPLCIRAAVAAVSAPQ